MTLPRSQWKYSTRSFSKSLQTSLPSSHSRAKAVSHNLKGFKPTFNDHANHKSIFNIFTTTAEELQHGLHAGKWRSTQIVEEYHRAIDNYYGYLNAVYELALGAMARAEEMDKSRAQGKVLGALHGIPILIKVSSRSAILQIQNLPMTGV